MIIPPKKVKTGIAATYNMPKELCTNDKQEQTSGNDSDNCYIIFPLKKTKIELATQEIEVEFQIEHKPKKYISYQQTRRYIDCGVYDSVEPVVCDAVPFSIDSLCAEHPCHAKWKLETCKGGRN